MNQILNELWRRGVHGADVAILIEQCRRSFRIATAAPDPLADVTVLFVDGEASPAGKRVPHRESGLI